MPQAMKTVIGADGIARNLPLSEDDEAQRLIDTEQHVLRMTDKLQTDTDRERDRRIASGFLFGGGLYQCRPDDQTTISGAVQLATLATMAGAQAGDYRWHGGETDFVWISGDNSLVTMDAPTVIEFGKAAAAWKQAHIFAGRALKDGAVADYTNDAYWPSNEV